MERPQTVYARVGKEMEMPKDTTDGFDFGLTPEEKTEEFEGTKPPESPETPSTITSGATRGLIIARIRQLREEANHLAQSIGLPPEMGSVLLSRLPFREETPDDPAADVAAAEDDGHPRVTMAITGWDPDGGPFGGFTVAEMPGTAEVQPDEGGTK